MKQRRSNAVRVERWQWQGGHKLELVPLTERLYKKWIRQLFGGTAPTYAKLRSWLWFESGTEPLYFAKHWTGFELDVILDKEKKYPWLICRFIASVPIARLFLNKNCWWVGPHIALPRPDLYVVTPLIGTIEMLRPPMISRQWARLVSSFGSERARKWAMLEEE